MAKVPLKAVLKECKRRGISFADDEKTLKEIEKLLITYINKLTNLEVFFEQRTKNFASSLGQKYRMDVINKIGEIFDKAIDLRKSIDNLTHKIYIITKR